MFEPAIDSASVQEFVAAGKRRKPGGKIPGGRKNSSQICTGGEPLDRPWQKRISAGSGPQQGSGGGIQFV